MQKKVVCLAMTVVTVTTSAACIQIEELHYDHQNPETYNGPVEQNSNNDLEAEVGEVETHVEAEVNTTVDADTQVDADAEVNAGVELGESDEESAPDNGGTVSVVGDGVSFEYDYHGPVDEHAVLRPSLGELTVTSLEWSVEDVELDEPTILDDADGFVWGEPREDGSYLLAQRTGAEAGSLFTWGTDSALCDDDDGCVGRAISAACRATIVMTVTLGDDTTRSARVSHESARPACW